MKKIIMLIMCYFTYHSKCNAQFFRHCNCSGPDSINLDMSNKKDDYLIKRVPEPVQKILNQRNNNLYFYKTINLIAEPSTLSSFSDVVLYEKKEREKDPFVLNADVQPPIALGGKRWGLNTIHIVPHFKVRILENNRSHGDSSLPVRTPSYIPELIYYFSFKKFNKLIDSGKFYFGAFKAFHHSDGQDQGEFDNNGNVNFYNGNFGENAIFELMLGKVWETRSCNATFTKRIQYAKLSYEYHDSNLTNKAFYKYDMYGRNRVNFQYGISIMNSYNECVVDDHKCYFVANNQVKEKWRLVINSNYIIDRKYNSGNNLNHLNKEKFLALKRLNIYATGYWIIPGSVNAALFLQIGYWGSDSYNIYFAQSIAEVRFGLAVAFFKYPKSGDLQAPVYTY